MRLATEIIAGRSVLPTPDWRIYYLFEVGKAVHVLRPMSMRIEHQARKVNAHGGSVSEVLH